MNTDNIMSVDDESLMVLVQDYNHQAFSLLIERHSDRFYRMAYKMTGQKESAEDIVQEAFLKIWNNPSIWDIQKSTKFTTWFYRVVANICFDKGRKNKRIEYNEWIEQFSDKSLLQDSAYYQKQQEYFLEYAIQSLPDKQKAALNLSYYDGISNQEGAEILEVSVKAFESLLMRAKSNIRTSLVREGILKEKEHA